MKINYFEQVGKLDFLVFSTDWQVEILLTYLEKVEGLERIELGESSWSITQKSQFIESLILGLPTGSFVFYVRSEDPDTFEVLDGKERLLAIDHFFGGRDGDLGFPLTGLTVLTSLEGLTIKQIRESYTDCLLDILEASLHISIIRDIEDEALLQNIKERVRGKRSMD